MARPNDTANQTQWGFASGGQHPDDTCPLENMQVKNRIPGKHGPLVLDEHLAYNNCMVPIGQQHIEAPVLDKGATTVSYQVAGLVGTNHSIVIGTAPQKRDPDGATAGNSLFSFLEEKLKEGSGTKIPSTIKQNGNHFQLIEKNIEHSLSLLNGMSSTGAQWAIAGMKEETIQQISTALDKFQNILSSDILSQLPGQIFQMSNLLDEMPQKLQDELFKNMPANVQMGMRNALQMMQTSLPADLPGMMTAGRINPEVFFQNVVNELKDVSNVGEMMSKLHQINSNNLLKGMDQFEDVLIEIEGAFGNIFQKISTDATGKITVELDIPDAIAQLQSGFQSLLGQLPGAGAASAGAFKNADLANVFSRFPPDNEKKFKEQIEKNVKGLSNDPKRLVNALRERAARAKSL